MFRKPYCCFLILLFVLRGSVQGQRFSQSAGATISVMHARGFYDDVNQSLDIVLTDLTYFPRLKLSEAANSSITLGMPVSVGVGLASDYTSNGKGMYWNFDLPLVADYNVGYKATAASEKKIGGYFGAGFGYTYTNWSFGGSSHSKAYSYGPMVRGGFRFGFPSGEKSEGFSVGLYYKFGVESEKYQTIGCNLLIDF